MPAASASRRAPLVDQALVPLSDSAVHITGALQTLTERALRLVDVARMSPLDSALATKLGGYTQLPPMPEVEAVASMLPYEPERFILTARAGALIAVMARDKDAMLRVLSAMRTFAACVPRMSEETLFSIGADALRLAVDLYRRTGQPFLLTLLESLRSRLPDVSGMLHVFPFQREYQPIYHPRNADERAYYERLKRFAQGKLTADSLAMSALLSQYSGSGRDASAAKLGLSALTRYHGMPGGAFSADPYLAGRDPSRGVDLPAVCAQLEAYHDALCASGEPEFAEKLETLLVNVLPDVLTEEGVRDLSPTNRLATDDSCHARAPQPGEAGMLLRALYALRRSVWMLRDDNTVAYLLPVAGGCLARLNGVPVRFTASVRGNFTREILIRAECRQPAEGALQLRVPAYADAAQLTVAGQAQSVVPGELVTLKRVFRGGEVIALTLTLSPRVEPGWRGSASVYVGSTLMALSLPDERASWRYALLPSRPLTPIDEGEQPMSLVVACEASGWREQDGFITPPPQGLPIGATYVLTLMPFAGTRGRVAAFPVIGER